MHTAQVKVLLERLLGASLFPPEGLPEPEVDFNGFSAAVRHALSSLPPVYNPRNGRMGPWVDQDKLAKDMKASRKAAGLVRAGSTRGSTSGRLPRGKAGCEIL